LIHVFSGKVMRDKNGHELPGAAKPQPKAIGNATEKSNTHTEFFCHEFHEFTRKLVEFVAKSFP